MTVDLRTDPGAADPARPAALRPARSRLRLATVGGIAAIALLGGGITAAASAGEPATSAVVAAATDTATPGTAATGTAAPGTAAPAAPPAAKAHQPHLDGTVTSVSGTTVLILDRDGFTRTIVESGTTTYQDGLKAALTVGSKIHAEGTVDANGTSLDATLIGADKGPAAGGPGGKGPGGPGKHAGAPVPPAGAPQPPAAGGTNAPTPPAAGGTDAPTAPAAGGTDAPTAPTGDTAAPAPSTMATTK